MALFNIFGKKDGSENNSAESHASEIAELRAKLARAEQERDALAREKNSLTQKVECFGSAIKFMILLRFLRTGI